MSIGKGENLKRLAEAITDEVVVDWATETRDHPELASLRLLARIGEVFQSPSDDAVSADPTEWCWGHLQILGTLGEGGYGTVYRAHDPRLRRDVALKLLRTDLVGGIQQNQRFLTEARLMARVNHPNVLVIHGADEHNGRMGFWTDLLTGSTLEERLATGEVLGADEAALYGRELCRALGAVHGAGLVHGDVKAANVMRDDEGRIVLMDFGAGSDSLDKLSGAGPMSGTPLTLAPELLAGGAPSNTGDIYALGVLLYRLVSGCYPVQADSLEELRRLHARGSHTPLLDLRPDLSNAFVQAVELALAPDPALRCQSAGQLEAALAASLQRQERQPAGLWRKSRWLAVVGLVALLSVSIMGVWNQVRKNEMTPLTASVTFLRTGAEVDETLANGALVRPGDTLGLILQLNGPAHVYVLNEDQLGQIYLLFPLAETDLGNPLARGPTQRLPGTWQGKDLDWQVTEGQGQERFLVVASKEPLKWLERRFGDFETPTRDRVSRLVQHRTNTTDPERGIGAVAEKPVLEKSADSRLEVLTNQLEMEAADHSGIWFTKLMLYNLGR